MNREMALLSVIHSSRCPVPTGPVDELRGVWCLEGVIAEIQLGGWLSVSDILGTGVSAIGEILPRLRVVHVEKVPKQEVRDCLGNW